MSSFLAGEASSESFVNHNPVNGLGMLDELPFALFWVVRCPIGCG